MSYLTFKMPENTVLVDTRHSEIPGIRYNSINDAIDYCETKSPSISNRWGVIVNGVNNENFTLSSWISIIGEKGNTILTGTIYSGSGDKDEFSIYNCRIGGYGGVLSLSASKDITLYNCDILECTTSSLNNMYLIDCVILNGGFSNAIINMYGGEIARGVFRDITTRGTFISGSVGDVYINFDNIGTANIIDSRIEGNIIWSGGTVNIISSTINNTVGNPLPNIGTVNMYGGTLEENMSFSSGATVTLNNVTGPATITCNTGVNLTTISLSGITITYTAGTWNNYGSVYDNRTSGLTATNMQSAIDEIVSGGVGGGVDFSLPTSPEEATGIIISRTVGTGGSVIAGQPVYLLSDFSGYDKATASNSNKMPALGLALTTGTDGDTIDILLHGYYYFTNPISSGYAYVSSAGGLLFDVGSFVSGELVQRVGYSITSNILYVVPTLTVVEVP